MKDQIERVKEIVRQDATAKGYLRTITEETCVIGGILKSLGCNMAINQTQPWNEQFKTLHTHFPFLLVNVYWKEIAPHTTKVYKNRNEFEIWEALMAINDSYDDVEQRRNALCNFLDSLLVEKS